MIIWINGAFGSGKTQTAYELHRRIPHSFVFDPEKAGYYLRKNIPSEITKSDFQDYSLWREINYSMLKYIASEYDGTIIVPMTLVNADYFAQIAGKLRADGLELNHFTLCASRETLLRRLRKRGEREGSWAAQQIDRCVSGLSDEVFRHHLDTDHLNIEEGAEAIASILGITLLPAAKGALRKSLQHLKTQIRHVRFFD